MCKTVKNANIFRPNFRLDIYFAGNGKLEIAFSNFWKGTGMEFSNGKGTGIWSCYSRELRETGIPPHPWWCLVTFSPLAMFEQHSICISFLYLLHCTGYPVVGPNVLRWTFPIGGTPTKESRLVQLIIGSIMVVSQATIVYLEWLLAPVGNWRTQEGLLLLVLFRKGEDWWLRQANPISDLDLSFEDSRRPPGLVLERATLPIKRTPNCSWSMI